jgi:hypothetical protein
MPRLPLRPRSGPKLANTVRARSASRSSTYGVLTADELPPHFAKMLGKLDANKDGKLTQPELAAGHEQFAARFARKHPQAKEPKSRSELLAHVSARFDKLDANKDGSLSPEELRKEHFRGHRGHWRRHATTT